MNSDRWSEVEKLYHDALEREPGERIAFLDQSPDEELRREVQSLLANEQKGDRLFENSPWKPSLRQFAAAEEPGPALAVGTRLGPYEIVSPIGAGGMGEVYRARDTRLNRTVAIKIVLPSYLDSEAARKRFSHEARALSSLNHPYICALYDVGHQNGIDYLVMEYLDGETLAQTLKNGRLPLDQALRFAIEIAEALDQAHRHGVIHRDLKPGNIMVTRDGHVKILDFGLAKQRRPAAESATLSLTEQGTVVGTAGYMSPEQVRGEELDQGSDLFSFGVILYEMLSGKQAFAGGSSVEVMNAVLKEEPPELPASVPPALARIVRRCLEKEPARRFQSAADLGFALESSSLSPVRTEPPRRRGWLKWAALLAACATAGAAYWLAVLPSRRSSQPEATFRRLTNDPGLTTNADISPDGKLVAYVSDRADSSNLDIWVQQVDGDGVVRITDDPADDYDPAFSPDATQIAFRSERAEPGIYVAPAIGGEARLVIPQGRRPRFSPDGQRLMYWTGPDQPGDVRGSSDTKVWVRPIGGGEATQIGAGCRLFAGTPVWSPDGSRILFVGTCGSDLATRGSQPENYGLAAWVATSDGKDLKPNRELYGLWRSIHSDPVIDQWIANPSRLLIPISVGDATSITAVPVSADGTRIGGPPQRLTLAGGEVTRVSAALNGRIALSTETSQSHIWTLPVDSEGAATGLPKQMTYGPAGEDSPALSADGEKLAFLSMRAHGVRLFYKDLATGREKEVSTEGYRYATPVFNHDGTKIMCVQYPNAESGRDFIFEVPISGGVSKKVWDKATWSWLFDWSPDGSTLLFLGQWPPGASTRDSLQELDVKSGATTIFLADSEVLERPRFSHDGRWVVFQKFPGTEFRAKPSRTRVFLAPFRKALVPRTEWIPVTDNNLDLDPHFSYNDRLIFFTSERDSSKCVWAQRLGRDMHADGPPFAVYHSHERRRPLGESLGVGPHAVVFDRTEMAGNVWLMEPAKRDVH